MANLYSTGYGLAPNANSTTYTYRGPQAERQGQRILRYSQYTGTLALADVLYISGGFAADEKLCGFSSVRSGDADTDNDLTVNLGWRVGTAATPAVAFLSASTGMQAAAALSIATDVLLPIQGAAEGDDLILTVQAGEAEASVTYSFLAESFIP